MTIFRRFIGLPVYAALLWASVCTVGVAHAQKPGEPAVAATPATAAATVTGNTFEKKAFNLATLKGKVVLVMFWSTDCSVCRDKMPELRENAQGWADKPFEVVLISVDRRFSDVESYNTILSKLVPIKQRFTQLWAGEASYKDNLDTANLPPNRLPTTLLIDKQGKLVERFSGRIPAEVWDKISDLL